MKVVSILLSIMFLSSLAFAHEEIRNPEDIISGIMVKQGVAGIKQIDCNKISSEDFEILGDAVMEKMAGDHELHEQMDVMVGGEGSASLKQMHRIIGSNWLGCNKGMIAQGVMNVNMMPMMMRMMGNYYPAYYSGYDFVLLFGGIGWVLLGITLYLHLTRKKRK